MMAPPKSLAEHYRAHRAAFELALELGCTPKEAADELRRREARARDREAMARLQAKMNAPLAPHYREPPADAPWMLRD
jgi:hypothetical protein